MAPRILIIDDDDGVREVLRLMLEGDGYEVESVSNGYDGVDRFRRNGADLVITDIVMEGMDGVETIMELRLISPSVKIIAISGGDQVAPGYYLSMIKNFDTVYEMEKPIRREDLIFAVRTIL
ncbi:MAG TPA: response regulator [Deltaproteobacteria bacterium]|nr:response regulator [Deltaproteobacteria bacterium]HOI06857.1 response regulator [Deltaproteobacteria bacterium]